MPINKPTIDEQVKHMLRPTVWGTHLEIKAAATLFQLPIYYCKRSTQTGSFDWNVVHPICPDNISFPPIMDEELEEKEDINHFEICYDGIHYDAIVSIETGKVCAELPELTGTEDPQIIDL